MTDSPLDMMIVGSAPDDVTMAAEKLITHLASRYEPLVEQSMQLLTSIPEDPVALGLDQFNVRLSQLRNDANILAQALGAVISEKRRCQERVKSAKTAAEEKLQILLIHDPEVKEITGQQQKLAMAKTKMSRELRLVDYADQIYTRVLGYYEALKLAHDTLADTKRDLMSQLAVIKQQIAIGEVSGNSFPVSRASVNGLSALEQDLARAIGPEGSTSF